MKNLLLLALVASILCAWCPWFEQKQALKLITAEVSQLNKKNPNSCPLNIDEKSLSKAFFGYTINVSYDCTQVDETMGVAKTNNSVLITFYNGFIGMPVHKDLPAQ